MLRVRDGGESATRPKAIGAAGVLDRPAQGRKEPDGTSLLEHTCLAYGSNIQSIHYLENCPTLIAGGGAGVKHGRHLVMKDRKTPCAISGSRCYEASAFRSNLTATARERSNSSTHDNECRQRARWNSVLHHAV